MGKIKELYLKHKEIVNYLIFGVLTTVINWIAYTVAIKVLSGGQGSGTEFDSNMFISNVFAWIVAVAFAFITNKLWVFESKSKDKELILKEAASFVGSRLGTGVIEIGLFPLLFELGLNESLFGVEGFVAKIIVSVIVIILNYLFSKFWVFKKAKSAEKEADK